MKPASVKPPRSCEYFVKPTPVDSTAATGIHMNLDGDSFKDIFSGHFLKLGRNIEQLIQIFIDVDIHGYVLQSLLRWPQYVGRAGPDFSIPH